MLPSKTSPKKTSRLANLRPWEIVGLVLLISFIVFTVFDLIEQSLAAYTVPLSIRLVHFVRGFLSCASGMILVWLIMSQKDTTIHEQRAVQTALLTEREDFLAVINHRLRNALLATDRAVKLMLHGDFGNLDPTQQTILAHISDNNSEIDRLIRMLVDIYDYRNGTKKIDLCDCSLQGVITSLAEEEEGAAEERCVLLRTKVEDECAVKAAPKELKALIQHLIENAIKHARSKVSICASKENNHILLAITDDGIGIADPDLSLLFDRFYSSSKDGKYPAVTGIGLCLCAEIAKAHGGKLSCQSQFGTGTTFLLSLPAA